MVFRNRFVSAKVLTLRSADLAHGDYAAVSVPVALDTGNPGAADEVGECERCVLAAAPGLAVRLAKLFGLGRVDAVQAYPLARYVDGIAVDDAGLAGDLGKGG